MASSTIATALLPEPTVRTTVRDVLSLVPWGAVRMTMAPSVKVLGGGGDDGAEIVVAVPPVTVSVTGPATPLFQPSAAS